MSIVTNVALLLARRNRQDRNRSLFSRNKALLLGVRNLLATQHVCALRTLERASNTSPHLVRNTLWNLNSSTHRRCATTHMTTRSTRSATRRTTGPERDQPSGDKPGDGAEVGGGPRFGRSGSEVGGRCSGLEGLRAPAPTAFQKNRTPAVPSPSPVPPPSLPAPLAEGRGNGPLHPEIPRPRAGGTGSGNDDRAAGGREGRATAGPLNGAAAGAAPAPAHVPEPAHVPAHELMGTPGSGATVIRMLGPEAGANAGTGTSAGADTEAGSGGSAGSCSELVSRMGLGPATAKRWKPWPGNRWASQTGNGRTPWYERL